MRVEIAREEDEVTEVTMVMSKESANIINAFLWEVSYPSAELTQLSDLLDRLIGEPTCSVESDGRDVIIKDSE